MAVSTCKLEPKGPQKGRLCKGEARARVELHTVKHTASHKLCHQSCNRWASDKGALRLGSSLQVQVPPGRQAPGVVPSPSGTASALSLTCSRVTLKSPCTAPPKSIDINRDIQPRNLPHVWTIIHRSALRERIIQPQGGALARLAIALLAAS